jgi:hypothetical protein
VLCGWGSLRALRDRKTAAGQEDSKVHKETLRFQTLVFRHPDNDHGATQLSDSTGHPGFPYLGTTDVGQVLLQLVGPQFHREFIRVLNSITLELRELLKRPNARRTTCERRPGVHRHYQLGSADWAPHRGQKVDCSSQ